MSSVAAIVVKVTDQCNLGCPYCYYYAGSAADLRRRKFPDIGERIEQFLDALSASTVCGSGDILFVLHGGEPLLLSKPNMERLVGGIRERFGAPTRIALQTNGVLIDEDWVRIFNDHQVSVGVSIDGPAHIHDEHRPDLRGRPSHARTIQGLIKLRQDPLAWSAQTSSVLAVFDPRLSGDEYFDYFIQELGVANLDILFPDDANERFDPAILHAAYRSATARIWERWAALDNPDVRIRFIDHALRAIASDRPAAYDPDHYRVIVADMKGDCFVEDGLRSVVPYENLRIANWITDGFDHAFAEVDAFSAVLKSLPEDCMRCRWLNPCKGGDFTYRYDGATGQFAKSSLCAFYDQNFTIAESLIASARRQAA